ncbi:hypothetical protein [Pontibacter chitinilyticus]|uniref:hypothetical protein n=1 Tax=Pontibacter chitinilyticus TaxID=2674989 RepID=UPI00321A142A
MEDKVELTSMVTILAALRKEGYATEFRITEDGLLCTMDEKACFGPYEVRITNFYRFEGETNPGDMAILYAIETVSGEKGTIVDAYGPYADETVENFMKQVEDLGKDIDKPDRK